MRNPLGRRFATAAVASSGRPLFLMLVYPGLATTAVAHRRPEAAARSSVGRWMKESHAQSNHQR